MATFQTKYNFEESSWVKTLKKNNNANWQGCYVHIFQIDDNKPKNESDFVFYN